MAQHMLNKTFNRCGFTLIELLVVVTIIVVLLALLVPAMDKAIYQAELVVCGTRQRAVSGAVLQYAFDHKRYYPYRGIVNQTGQAVEAYVTPMNLVTQLFDYDLRPPLKGYVASINGWLQCPFAEPVDMEGEGVEMTNQVIETSYMLMWGWQYRIGGQVGRGMFKIGDRFTTQGDPWANDGSKYSLLVGDMDLLYPNLAQASHPDRDTGRMSPFVWKEHSEFGAVWTLSRWSVANSIRSLLDSNYAYDDGSVLRMDGVVGWGNAPELTDERMDRIPLEYDGARLNDLRDRFHVPRK